MTKKKTSQTVEASAADDVDYGTHDGGIRPDVDEVFVATKKVCAALDSLHTGEIKGRVLKAACVLLGIDYDHVLEMD
jgi:hypothetical protein